jgi:hypothetical protein
VTGWWFSPGIPVSSTNNTDLHHIAEILLKVALNTILNLTLIIGEIHPVNTSNCICHNTTCSPDSIVELISELRVYFIIPGLCRVPYYEQDKP